MLLWYNAYKNGVIMKNLVLLIATILLTSMCTGCRAGVEVLPLAPEVVLSESNTIQINLPILGSTAAEVQKQLLEKDSKLKKGKPLYIVLNTPGGSIQDGLMIIETAKSLKRPVHTISLFSASMGFVISQYLGDRLAIDSAIIMTHKARVGGVGGDVPGSFINMANYLLNYVNSINERIAKRSGKELEDYNRLIESDFWMGTDLALDHNFIDKRVTVSCDESLRGYADPQEVDLGFFAVTVQFHKCPLITQPQLVKGDSKWFNLLVNDKKSLINALPHIFQ
jgi:ATP-dependent Clp protease protease subunit